MEVDCEKSPFNDARITNNNEIIGIGMNKKLNNQSIVINKFLEVKIKEPQVSFI